MDPYGTARLAAKEAESAIVAPIHRRAASAWVISLELIFKEDLHLVSRLSTGGRRRPDPVLSFDQGPCQGWFFSRWTVQVKVRRKTRRTPVDRVVR